VKLSLLLNEPPKTKVAYYPPSGAFHLGNGAKSFHSNKNAASKKKPPPPTIPLIGGVDVLKEM
jgi:hypothetical protein